MKRISFGRFARVAFALVLGSTLSSPAFADGLVRDGVGAISTGRGGTNLGYADNGAIILDNPGAMSNVAGSGLWEVGVDVLMTDIHYTDPANDTRNRDQAFPLPHLAYIKHLDSHWTFGIGAFAPAGFGAKYDMPNSPIGPSTYKSLGGLGKILPSLSYQVTDNLSIGGSLGIAFSHVELEGPLFLPAPGIDIPTKFDMQGTGVAPTGSIGLQYQLTDRTTLGLTYTEESRFKLDGNVSAFVPAFNLESRFDADIDIVWPRSAGFGLMHQLSDTHRVSADVIWYDWSHAFDQLDITLTNASNPLAGFILGPNYQTSLPLAWKDTVSLRLGYEWDTSCCSTWRFGYVYHDSPVPNNTLSPYLDGILEHAFSVGYTRRLSACSLNVAYQYSFADEREVGTSIVPGGNFNNSTLDVDAHWLGFSVLVPF